MSTTQTNQTTTTGTACPRCKSQDTTLGFVPSIEAHESTYIIHNCLNCGTQFNKK